MQKTEAQNSNNMLKSIPLSESELLTQQLSQQLALQNNSEDEIDLAELWRAIWSGKLLIIVISFVFAVSSIFFALSKPDVYKASILLAPSSSDSAGGMGALAGQFGGLASLAGISLGGGGTDKTALALEIIKSRAFLETFIIKHNLLVPLIASEKWDRINDELIFDDEVYDVENNKWIREVSFPKTMVPSPWEAYQEFLQLISVSQDKIGSNLLDAIANGTTEGLKLAANVGAMLLVFIAFIAMINFGFEKVGAISGLNYWISDNTTYQFLSIEFILGYTFSPVMWIIGVAKEDMALMGQLLGIKLAVSEFIGYMQLAELKDISNMVHLQYEKSIIMATYMLCGFANFASIGIQIGGIGSLAPNQRTNLSKFGMIAVLGGTLASLLSATIAGMIIG